MKTKTRDDRLDVRKVMADLKKYEDSPARGGLRIDVPVEQAVKILAKAKPEPKKTTQSKS